MRDEKNRREEVLQKLISMSKEEAQKPDHFIFRPSFYRALDHHQ